MDRTTARAHAMKLIYEWEMGGEGGEETCLNLLEIEPGENESDFMDAIVSGVKDSAEEIDQTIAGMSTGWSIERITRVDLAILRLGVYELMKTDTPAGIVINEAIELAKTYSTEKAGGFINGVLGNLARKLERV